MSFQLIQRVIFASVHVVLWGMVIGVATPAPIGLGQFKMSIFHPEDLVNFLLYGFLLNALMIYSYAHLALPRYFRTNSLVYLVVINLAYLAFFIGLESVIDYFYMKTVYQQGEYAKYWNPFSQWLYTNAVITAIFMLIANFYGFTYGWFNTRQQRRTLEKAKLQAELLALKHQINPHFLFNVLNGLYGLAFQNDDEPTADGIARLSQLMRYMLYDSNASKVPLDKEVAYLRDYIALQRLRIHREVDINFDASQHFPGKEITPMILIPFVENAFKHGISTVMASYVHISLSMEDNRLHFQVKNPMHPGGQSSSHGAVGGIGLQNVRQRLEMIYPDSYQLDIGPANGIYEVNLTLDL